MSLGVFLFAKKMKFFTKGGIHCISQVFPWNFYFMREHSLVELTEHDDSAANIIVHTVVCIHICTAAFIVVVVVSHIQRIGCQPEKTTLHGGQSRSWSAEQGKENKIKSLAAYPPPHPPHCSFGENK